MKAAVVCANEDVQYLDYEEPQAGPGEVKVKVKASGICGSDIPRVLHNGVHFYPIVLAVSYTHLDVYKRQHLYGDGFHGRACSALPHFRALRSQHHDGKRI